MVMSPTTMRKSARPTALPSASAQFVMRSIGRIDSSFQARQRFEDQHAFGRTSALVTDRHHEPIRYLVLRNALRHVIERRLKVFCRVIERAFGTLPGAEPVELVALNKILPMILDLAGFCPDCPRSVAGGDFPAILQQPA